MEDFLVQLKEGEKLMRGSAAVFIIGMFAAAVVGIAASFAMQSVLPEGIKAEQTPEAPAVDAENLASQLGGLEQRLRSRADELTTSVEILGSEVQAMRRDLANLKMQIPVAASGSGEDGEGVVAHPADFGEAINRVLDDRDKRREEEKDQEREQRSAEMRERFKGMMASRTDRFVKEKGWDAIQTDQVKQIMSDYMEKMSELGMMLGWRREGGSEESREQVHQLMEETRTKLREIMPEEEVNKLLRGGGMGLGPGGRGAASK
jgi:hypothetical protein